MSAETAPGDARDLVTHVVNALASIERIERIWSRGVVHRGGPHYRLSGTTGPVSIGADECLLLASVIERFRPSTCFIIGNGFGLSSAFISKVMERHDGESVITIDDLTEGDGARCYAAADHLRQLLNCRLLRSTVGHSPRDITRCVEDAPYDLALIDGNHAHPQATEDYRALRPFLHRQSIICWHDFWLPGVVESVLEAERAGYRCLKVNSSCEMVFGTRDEATASALATLFHTAERPVARHHPWGRLTLTRSFVGATLRARVAHRHRLK